MNVEEKIKKKEKRRNFLRKIYIPIIFIIIILVILFISIYILLSKNKYKNTNVDQNTNQNINIDDKQAEDIEEQFVGINNGTDKISYKGYTYIHKTGMEEGSVIIRKKDNEEKEEEVVRYIAESFSNNSLWIYKDKIYVYINNYIRRYNLDGSEETKIIKTYNADIYVDTEKELIYCTYDNEDTNNCEIAIVKLDGTILKVANSQDDDGYVRMEKVDDINIYYSVTIYDSDWETIDYDERTILIKLYSLNKETYENKKLSEEVVQDGSSYGIYELKDVGDYLYYVIGSQQGTGNYFYGHLSRARKDGTEYEVVGTTGELDIYEIPEIELSKNYLYFDGFRINLQNNQKMDDNFKNGDIVDESEFVYTTSLTDSKTITLVKYKAGTNYEDLQVLFSEDVNNGANASLSKKEIKFDGDFVYLTIYYRDMDIGNWKGTTADSKTYCIKKDGSEFKEV